MKGPVLKQTIYYFGFGCLFWLIHRIFFSVISFLHLLLDHRFNVIGDWMFRNGWWLLNISKVLALFTIIRFLNANFRAYEDFKNFFKENYTLPSSGTCALVIYLFIINLWIYRPDLTSWNYEVVFSNFIPLVLGSTFFLFDFFLLSYLSKLFPLENTKSRVFYVGMMPILFLFFQLSTLPQQDSYAFPLYLHFLTFFLLDQFKRSTFMDVILYTVCIIAPFSIYFGLSPKLGHLDSPFPFLEKFSLIRSVPVWLAGFLYLGFLNRTRNDRANC